ncbi:DUF5313 family protein [Amycolatopsis sp. 195334CR]|uniref:DUF5313 family protein n=1 Tax=Amycolatopsis sp. 195334CR TaxID=2814588 RepID=UPI001A8DF364|nr:DUF5313 family protein [Amycolatopsis sp. 195334CR]MBN6041900.1 DUF5313 family protein [Amycolatopsis sp. 195334CR]
MRNRPNPVLWLWYALGGRLPDRHREWVLHDVTAKTWILRHGARSTVLILPLVSVWLLLPGPLGLRLSLVLMAALVGYFYSFAYVEESGEHRLAKHGYPRGTGRQLRAEAKEAAEAEVTRRYLARYRD